jgi:hypothetical protein
MLLIHHKLEVNTPLLIEEPTKEYKFPIIERSILEDAFDGVEFSCFVFTI